VKAVRKNKPLIDWEDFNQIFCKGIFKEVLISLAKKINIDQRKKKKEASLGGKLNEYQRKLLLEQLAEGLITDKHSEQKESHRPVLQSLYYFKKDKGSDPYFDETYKEFLKDPLGSQRKAMEEADRKAHKLDDFVRRI